MGTREFAGRAVERAVFTGGAAAGRCPRRRVALVTSQAADAKPVEPVDLSYRRSSDARALGRPQTSRSRATRFGRRARGGRHGARGAEASAATLKTETADDADRVFEVAGARSVVRAARGLCLAPRPGPVPVSGPIHSPGSATSSAAPSSAAAGGGGRGGARLERKREGAGGRATLTATAVLLCAGKGLPTLAPRVCSTCRL